MKSLSEAIDAEYDVSQFYKVQDEQLEDDYRAGKLGRQEFLSLRKELREQWDEAMRVNAAPLRWRE